MLSHSPSIVTDGLVLCLDAANPRSYGGSGTNWGDLSGNGNHFTLTNGPTYSGDNLGGVVFDGVDDYALPASATPFQVNSLTIEVWFKLNQNLNSSSGFKNFFSAYSNPLGYQLSWHPTSQYFYFFAGGTTAINTSAFSNGTFSSGDIINLVCRFNTADYSINDIFVNNIKSTGSRVSNPSVTNGTQPPYIGGRRPDLDNYYLNQNIFIVKFYNKTLTDDEIKQNFKATRGRFGI